MNKMSLNTKYKLSLKEDIRQCPNITLNRTLVPSCGPFDIDFRNAMRNRAMDE